MPHIAIIGAGFAGCTAIRTLRKQGFKDPITLIAPRAELFYYPSLIWVASGKRKEQDLRIDLQNFLHKHQVTFKAARATGLDPVKNCIHTDNEDVSYDYLIIASGGRYLQKLPGIEQAHIACSGWEATESWVARLQQLVGSNEGGDLAFGFAGNPKEPSAMRGGPVFEFLFGTDTWLRQLNKRDQFRLHFFSPAPKPGARMGEKAVDRLLGEMQRRNIQTHLGHKMKSIGDKQVSTENETFASDLTLFIPGMTGPQWATDSGLTLSEGGFFKANQHCRVEGSDNVYVAGDAGSFPGPEWKPKQAHMADLQAASAAHNILRRLNGQADDETFKTELMCIVDSLDNGTMVYRSPQRAMQLRGIVFHWAKALFEWNYLRAYR